MQEYHFHKTDTETTTSKVLDNFHNDFAMKLKKEDIAITIKRLKKSPNDKQRGYIFGYLLLEIQKGMLFYGNEYTIEEVYQFMKGEGGFYKVIVIKSNNKEIKRKIYESFSNNGDKKRTAEFCSFCLRWAAENLPYVVLETPEEYKLKRGISWE